MVNAFIVEWTGPYTDPKTVAENNIIYMITGNLSKGPVSEKVRYVGITTNDPATRFDCNHKFWNLTADNRKFWIGKIKFVSFQRYSDAEWLLVHYLYSQQKYYSEIDLLNERKKSEPQSSICIINRWYKACNRNEYSNYIFPIKYIPDMIYWDVSRKSLICSDKIYIEKEN